MGEYSLPLMLRANALYDVWCMHKVLRSWLDLANQRKLGRRLYLGLLAQYCNEHVAQGIFRPRKLHVRAVRHFG